MVECGCKECEEKKEYFGNTSNSSKLRNSAPILIPLIIIFGIWLAYMIMLLRKSKDEDEMEGLAFVTTAPLLGFLFSAAVGLDTLVSG
jgi:hypothetical protein